MTSYGLDVGSESPQAVFLIVVTIISALALYYVVGRLFLNRQLDRFYASQPCPGYKQRHWLSWFSATLSSIFDTADRVKEGYATYGKRNIPFLIPNIRKGPVLVIPPAQLKTVLSNPENKLTAHIPQAESVSSKYTMKDPNIQPTNYEVDLVRKQITKRFGSVAEELADEVSLALDDAWGASKEWKTVVAWGSLEDVAARAVNRIIFGLPLCRDDEFLKRSIRYSMSILRDGPAISLLPKLLKPILGPLITWKGQKDCEACIRILIPLIEERLKQLEQRRIGSSDGLRPSNDILQWAIEESYSTGNPEQITSRRIAHRLVMLNFNSVPPVGLTLSHLLFDLYSAPPSEGFVDTLRGECDQVIKETPEKHWSKDAVSRLVLLDSTIRESMRHSDFGWTAFPRRVLSPTGIPMSPSLNVPPGVNLEIPMHSIHMDPDFHPQPTRFAPFRFAPSSTGPTNPDYAKALVTLDDTFLAFGYRQNGCPGRFFAAFLMKVIMANVLQKYDVEEMRERPEVRTLMEFRVPREDLTVRVRRRSQNYY